MNESDAQLAVLVRALELADDSRTLVEPEDQAYATRAAHRAVGQQMPPAAGLESVRREIFILHRAQLILERLRRRHPLLGRIDQLAAWPAWLSWGIPLAGLLLGLGASALTSDRRIDLIAFPVVGMLLWNMTVYAFLGLRLFFRSTTGSTAQGWVASLLLLVPRRGMHRAQPGTGDKKIADAMRRFAQYWIPLAQPLHARRLQASLHCGAALFASGIVAGMYLSALALEYRAGWESTFLDERHLHRVLQWVLGPASMFTGIAIPGPEELRLLRWGPGQPGEIGARWIHLYAVTIGLSVVLPRLILAAIHGYYANALKRRFPLPMDQDAYFRKLLAPLDGSVTRVQIIPYSYHPNANLRQALDRAHRAAYGDRTEVAFEPAIPYGAEDDFLETWMMDRPLPDRILLLFSLAATPEQENHGALIDGIRQRLDNLGAGDRLAVVLDESAYRRKAAEAMGNARIASRREAWNAMLRLLDIRAAMVDIEETTADGLADAIESVRAEATEATWK